MPIIGEAATINAPIEKIFNYVGTPSNLPEFWPSLVEVTDIKPVSEGRYEAKYVYKMAGIRFNGTGEYTEAVPNKSLVIVTKGGIKSILTWTFRSQSNRTRVSVVVDYQIPIPLLGRLANIVIESMNKHETTLILANLQARFLFSHDLDKLKE
ncbi:SRPBCC family protein [Chloroflexota bacterium]